MHLLAIVGTNAPAGAIGGTAGATSGQRSAGLFGARRPVHRGQHVKLKGRTRLRLLVVARMVRPVAGADRVMGVVEA